MNSTFTYEIINHDIGEIDSWIAHENSRRKASEFAAMTSDDLEIHVDSVHVYDHEDNMVAMYDI